MAVDIRRHSQCFVLDLATDDIFQFQLGPPEVHERSGASIQSVLIPGESLPRIVAGAGQARTIEFDVSIFAESEERGTAWVRERVRWLMSLKYARTSQLDILGRRRVTPAFLVLGQLLALPVYMESVDVTWGPFKNILMGPMVARISLSFTEANVLDEFIDAVAARDGRLSHTSFDVEVL